MKHGALVIGGIVAIHVHDNLSANFQRVALGPHGGVPLLHGTITIAAIIDGLHQRGLGGRGPNRVGQRRRVGLGYAGTHQKRHGKRGRKGGGLRFS